MYRAFEDMRHSDISEKQLEHAQEIADKLHLRISFVCDDTMRLSKLKDNEFDLVYTSNGTHTWIADLAVMYQNIERVLKPSGFSICMIFTPLTAPLQASPGKRLR